MKGKEGNDRHYAYIATLISSVTFGMYIMLSFSTIQILLRQRRAGTRNRVLFVYACTMAVLTAIWYTVGAIWSEQDFLNFDPDDRNKFELLQCTPLGIAKDELAALMLIGSDALLLHRTYVVWDGYWPILVMPCLIYASTFVLGQLIVLLCIFAPDGKLPDPKLSQHIGFAFFSLSILLNVLTTLLVVRRLLAHRRALVELGVLAHDAARFASVVGILAESAALYTIVGVAYVPLFVSRASYHGPMSSLFAAMSYLCPAWIVLRCAKGDAYERAPSLASSHTMTVDIDSIAFAPNAEVGRPRNSEDDGDSTLGGDFLAARGGSRSESHSDEEDGRGFRMTFAQKPGRRRVDWAEEEEHEYRRSSTVRPGRSRSRESGDSAERQPLWDSRSDKSGGSYSSIEENPRRRAPE